MARPPRRAAPRPAPAPRRRKDSGKHRLSLLPARKTRRGPASDINVRLRQGLPRRDTQEAQARMPRAFGNYRLRHAHMRRLRPGRRALLGPEGRDREARRQRRGDNRRIRQLRLPLRAAHLARAAPRRAFRQRMPPLRTLPRRMPRKSHPPRRQNPCAAMPFLPHRRTPRSLPRRRGKRGRAEFTRRAKNPLRLRHVPARLPLQRRGRRKPGAARVPATQRGDADPRRTRSHGHDRR